MLLSLTFQQVDVFASKPFGGNPLAVVVGADELTDEQMAKIANWTNLSETTFLLKPTSDAADYRVRIFTPSSELPFAGHPTLGTAYVWRALGGKPREQLIRQECGVGIVQIREKGGNLAFAAPPTIRSGAIDPETFERAIKGLGLDETQIAASQWVDNGPGWLAIRLHTQKELLDIVPNWAVIGGLKIGAVAPVDASENADDAQFELRAFVGGGDGFEDPVTGSLNASVAQWLIRTNVAPTRYVAAQGTALGRAGRVFVESANGEIWIGGHVITRISGTLTI